MTQQHLASLYERIASESRQTLRNTVRQENCVRLNQSDELEFLPAASVAIQMLVPTWNSLHSSIVDVVERIRDELPDVAASAFWQPPGTFHLNVAILIRLRPRPEADEERQRAIDLAQTGLDYLAAQPPYDVHFRGLLLARDGTLMCRGFPADDTPERIRDEFAAHGFSDQQTMMHITVARLLRLLPENRWARLRGLVEREFGVVPTGTLTVDRPLLIDELEGYMHCPESYRVVRQFCLERRAASDENYARSCTNLADLPER